MNQFFTPYIYILFLLVGFFNLHAQKKNTFQLQIISVNSAENKLLSTLEYKKTTNNKKSLNQTIRKQLNFIKNLGYYSARIDSIKNDDQKTKAYYHLGPLTNVIRITFADSQRHYFSTFTTTKTQQYVLLKPKALTAFLTKMQDEVSKMGKVFSKVQLKNHRIEHDTLSASIEITNSNKRRIDSIIIKGTQKVPQKFIKQILKKNKDAYFSKEKLRSISNELNSLNFVEEFKQPEILFSKDSTLLYIYLKKKASNNFDGLINFSTNEQTNALTFNGYLNLQLYNVFKAGEEVAINWRNNGDQKQAFTSYIKIPYLFNSSIHSSLNFSLYRQDSSFINRNASISISTKISQKMNLGVFYESKTSNNTLKQPLKEIQDFNTSSTGLELNYHNNNTDFRFFIKTGYGTTIKNTNKSNPLAIRAGISKLFKLTKQWQLFIKNTTSYINVDNLLLNELERIGGINTIRGFKEESIYTSTYSYINSEFRWKTQKDSYLYSVFDFGHIKQQNNSEELLGVGIGYKYTTSRNSLDISYVIGKTSTTDFLFKASKIGVKLLTYF